MPQVSYVAEDEVSQPKSAHVTKNMIAFDEIVRPLANGDEEVIKMYPDFKEDGTKESARGLRLSVHRAATRNGIKVKTWEATDGAVFAKLTTGDEKESEAE